MYEDYYHMKSKAFPSLPTPSVFFESEIHKGALRYLRSGIEGGEPYLLVHGTYGMGKTLLCFRLIEQHLKKEERLFIHIPTPVSSYAELVKRILRKLEVTPRSTDEGSLEAQLFGYLEQQRLKGGCYPILLDEVQEYQLSTLMKIRMLSNYSVDGLYLFQFVFFAHTSLVEQLSDSRLAALDQRIRRRYELEPFDYEDTKEYIYFRLLESGAIGTPYFPPESMELVHRYSGGVPRLINNICDSALIFGASRSAEVIEREIVSEAVSRLGLDKADKRPRRPQRQPREEGEDLRVEMADEQRRGREEKPDFRNLKGERSAERIPRLSARDRRRQPEPVASGNKTLVALLAIILLSVGVYAVGSMRDSLTAGSVPPSGREPGTSAPSPTLPQTEPPARRTEQPSVPEPSQDFDDLPAPMGAAGIAAYMMDLDELVKTTPVEEAPAESPPRETIELPSTFQNKSWTVEVTDLRMLPEQVQEMDAMMIYGVDSETVGQDVLPNREGAPVVSMDATSAAAATDAVSGTVRLEQPNYSFAVLEVEVRNNSEETQPVSFEDIRLEIGDQQSRSLILYAVGDSSYRSPEGREGYVLRFPAQQTQRMRFMFDIPEPCETASFVFPTFGKIHLPVRRPEGDPEREFLGLEDPPPVTAGPTPAEDRLLDVVHGTP